MKKTYFTVGPSQIYPTVPKHVKNALSREIFSMLHRGPGFSNLYKSVDQGLKKLLNIPSNYRIVFVASAHEAMERSLQGMSHNNSFHINTGFFGKMWQNVAKDLGKTTLEFKFFDAEKRKIADISFENIKIPKESELVCITQNDTSVGFSIPMEEIYALRKKYPKKLFALDIVSSAPLIDIEYKFLDAVFFSVQKGFGLPAGLGVLILSPNAYKKAQKLSQIKGYSIGSYHNLVNLWEKSLDFATTETPNVLGIYLLGCITEDFLKIGINKIRKETQEKAQMLYSFFSKQSLRSDNLKPENYKAFVKNSRYRSMTTPVFDVNGHSEALRKFTAGKGLILGAGYGDFKNSHIRIANFPAQSTNDVKKLINVLKTYYSKN